MNHRPCLGCGYDLSATPADPSGAGWLCSECGRMNGPDDYYLALQKIMGPRAWLATVFGLTALNVALCVGQLSLGHGVAVVLGLGPFVSLLEAAVVCGVAGRRAQAHVRSEKMLMLAGALCCFTFVGTLLATGVAVALWLGNI